MAFQNFNKLIQTPPYLKFNLIFLLLNTCILSELAKLDKTERRYAWFKRRLRTNEEIWKTFPASWHIDYLMCIQFCKLTRFVIFFFLNQCELYIRL